MTNIIQYAFTSLWIIAVAVALYGSRNWNSTTSLFPHAVGFPILALLVVILAVDIRKGRRQKEKGETEDKEFLTKNRWMILYLGWLVGFAFLIWAIGMVYSIPIYLFSYMTIQGKYSWLKSGIYAVAATALVFVLFQYVFGVAWPDGVLLTMLGLI
jgi:phosphatidylserine synthase